MHLALQMKALILVIDSIWEDIHPEMKMQNGLEQKNFSILFLQTTARSAVFLILGTLLYKQDFYIVGFSSTNWPLMAHRFLSQRGISVLHIRCQDCQVSSKEINIFFSQYWIAKVLSRYGENTVPDFDSISIADTREQEANPCWQTAQKWWMSRLEYLFQITLHLLETIH